MSPDVDTDLKAIPPVGIDIHAKEVIGLEVEVEDQGLDSDSSAEALEMSAMNLIGAEAETETETWDISLDEAVGLAGSFTSAFKQFTKVLTPIGIALDFMAVERVGLPVLDFENWGQIDITFTDDAMNVPYTGLP